MHAKLNRLKTLLICHLHCVCDSILVVLLAATIVTTRFPPPRLMLKGVYLPSCLISSEGQDKKKRYFNHSLSNLYVLL